MIEPDRLLVISGFCFGRTLQPIASWAHWILQSTPQAGQTGRSIPGMDSRHTGAVAWQMQAVKMFFMLDEPLPGSSVLKWPSSQKPCAGFSTVKELAYCAQIEKCYTPCPLLDRDKRIFVSLSLQLYDNVHRVLSKKTAGSMHLLNSNRDIGVKDLGLKEILVWPWRCWLNFIYQRIFINVLNYQCSCRLSLWGSLTAGLPQNRGWINHYFCTTWTFCSQIVDYYRSSSQFSGRSQRQG